MQFFQKPKKSLGQNFLTDINIIKKIIKIINIENRIVLEIGPGYGGLTNKILNIKPKKILAVEKDKKLSLFLKEKFRDFNNIKIINKDILSFFEENNLDSGVIVFGNLPYNISTKILASLILLKKWPPWYETLIFMFQKEVADRILAKTKTKDLLDKKNLKPFTQPKIDLKKYEKNQPIEVEIKIDLEPEILLKDFSSM